MHAKLTCAMIPRHSGQRRGHRIS